jgi:hypothetical protein
MSFEINRKNQINNIINIIKNILKKIDADQSLKNLFGSGLAGSIVIEDDTTTNMDIDPEELDIPNKSIFDQNFQESPQYEPMIEDEPNSNQDYNINDDVLFIINEILKINPDFFKIIVQTLKDLIINNNLNLLNVIEKYDVFENLYDDFNSFNNLNNDEFKNLFNLDNFSQLLKFILNIIVVDNYNNVNSDLIIENISKIIDSSVNIIKIFNLF